MLNHFWWTILAMIIGLFGGFTIANLVHRSDSGQINLPAPVAPPESANEVDRPKDNSPDRLTSAELTAALAQADAQPQNYPLNREIGLALFRYSILENDLNLTGEAMRVLSRIPADKMQRDEEVLTACADAFFILGRERSPLQIKDAQNYYRQLLNFKNNDPDVLVKIGLTYFHTEPAEPETAMKFYRQALEVNPKHELALLSLANVAISVGAPDQAVEVIKELRQRGLNASSLSDVETQIAKSALK